MRSMGAESQRERETDAILMPGDYKRNTGKFCFSLVSQTSMAHTKFYTEYEKRDTDAILMPIDYKREAGQ